MKKVFFLLLLQPFFLQAQDGIQFVSGTWDEILQKAKMEDKLVFVDAYTTWCGPCKQMSKRIFPQKAVGDFFNSQFINAKINMEKGEGPRLAERYGVVAYPSLLFIDSYGRRVHQSVGFHSADQLLELGADALNPTKQLASLEEKYLDGDRSANFLYNYLMARAELQDGSHTPILKEYLATQTNWKSDRNIELIYRFADDAQSKEFEYLVDNKEIFIDKYGDRAVTSKIQNVMQAALYSEEGDVLEKADRLFPLVYPEKGKELASSFKVQYFLNEGQYDQFAKQAIEHYKIYPANNWDELNEIAWSFYENVDNRKYLKRAVKMAKKSIKMANEYYNNDTLAALYAKLGKKRKAIKTAKNAIAIAKANDEDYSATEDLLKELQQ